MTLNYVPLNKEKHKTTRLKNQMDLAATANTHLASVSIREFASLASSMPIVFIKDPGTGKHHTVSVLGTEQGNNLFYADERWQVAHVPMNIQRYPFDVRPDAPERLGIYIDENCSLVGETEGERLFDDEGNPTEFLQNRQKFLSEITNSELLTQQFVAKVVELDLLEEIEFLVKYQSGQSRRVTGIMTIAENKLTALPSETIYELFKNGFLGSIYSLMLSLGQLHRLVDLSNKTDNPIEAMQVRPAQADAPEQSQAADTPVQ